MDNQAESIVYEPLLPYDPEYIQSSPIIYKVIETHDPKGKKIRFVLKFYQAGGWDNLVRVHPEDTHEAPDYCKRWDKFLVDYPEFEDCSPVGVFWHPDKATGKDQLIQCRIEWLEAGLNLIKVERFKITRIGRKYVYLKSDEYSGEGYWRILRQDLLFDSSVRHPYPLAKRY